MDAGFVVTSLGTGGAETMVLRHVRYADRDPTVFWLGGATDLRSEFEAAGATTVQLDVPSIASASALRRARSRIAAVGPDVLHAHLPSAMIVARVAGRAAGVDTVVSTHHRAKPYPHPLRFAERATRPLDSREVAVSKSVYESQSSFVDVPSWSVVPNAIDVRRFHRRVREAEPPAEIDPSGPTFLNVGRYVPEKGQRHLVEAMSRVVDERPDAEALLVGYGPLRDELEALVERRGVADAVSVVGKVPIDEVPAYYAAADAFVLPSLDEGLPITVLESMAAKLPFVGTRIPALEEVVTDDTGVLVPPGSPDRLADALLALADGSGASMGERAYERAVERFDVERMVADYEKLYATAVEA